MFFEDEKDIIGNNNPDVDLFQDNDSFGDILGNDADDLISIKSAAEEQSALNNADDISDFASSNLDEELKFVDESEDDDVDDAELARILNEDDTSSRQRAFDAFGTPSNNNSSQEPEEEFDLEQQLKDLNIEQEGQEHQKDDVSDEEEIPFRPNAKISKKGSMGPVAIAVALGTLIVVGSYFAIDNVKNSLLAKNKSIIENTQQNYEDTVQENIQEIQQEAIPVINEEEISSIKPDTPEKKGTIDVDSAGRVNPFMPLEKYVAVDVVQQSGVDYSISGIPQAPEKYGEIDETAKKLLKIAVSGIMYDDVKPSAIITLEDNDYFVQKGDKLDDYRIVDITRSGVKIALGKNIYKANIGEEFKISSFYGNTAYIPTKQGNVRQYQLITKDGANNSKDFYKKYTSEDDIEVIPE